MLTSVACCLAIELSVFFPAVASAAEFDNGVGGGVLRTFEPGYAGFHLTEPFIFIPALIIHLESLNFLIRENALEQSGALAHSNSLVGDEAGRPDGRLFPIYSHSCF